MSYGHLRYILAGGFLSLNYYGPISTDIFEELRTSAGQYQRIFPERSKINKQMSTILYEQGFG